MPRRRELNCNAADTYFTTMLSAVYCTKQNVADCVYGGVES